MKQLLSRVAIIFLSLAMFNCKTNSQTLEGKLTVSLKNFTDAVKSKDAAKFKAALCSSRYIELKNQVLSGGMDFPKGFLEASQESVSDYFDLGKLNFQKAIENGNTANLIYTQVKPEPQVYVYKFVKENGDWKYDWIDVTSNDEIRKKIFAADYTFLNDDKFKPTGIVPEVPQEIMTFGEYMAFINIWANGYSVQVKINGVLQKKIEGSTYSGMIMGGVKKGKNTITIYMKKKENDDRNPTDVTIGVSINASIEGETKEVYSIEEGDPRSEVTAEFEVQ